MATLGVNFSDYITRQLNDISLLMMSVFLDDDVSLLIVKSPCETVMPVEMVMM